MSSAYLVVSEGSSNKFWSIKVDGSKTTVSYGKIGAAGQTQEKDHGSSENAKKFADKMIREKEKKGYERSSEGSAEKGKKRQAKRGKGSDDDGDGSEGSDAEEDGDDGDEEPKPKRSAVEIAAAAKLEAVVREKLAPHRSALLADLQKLAATGTFKKADKVLFEIQPDGLQHPGFPVVAFLHTEEGDEMPNDVDLLEGIPTLLPEEELRKAYPEKVDMEGESGEGSFEVQSKALAVWLADCYKELGLNKRKPHAVIALHDDNMVLDTRTLKWREDDD